MEEPEAGRVFCGLRPVARRPARGCPLGERSARWHFPPRQPGQACHSIAPTRTSALARPRRPAQRCGVHRATPTATGRLSRGRAGDPARRSLVAGATRLAQQVLGGGVVGEADEKVGHRAPLDGEARGETGRAQAQVHPGCAGHEGRRPARWPAMRRPARSRAGRRDGTCCRRPRRTGPPQRQHQGLVKAPRRCQAAAVAAQAVGEQALPGPAEGGEAMEDRSLVMAGPRPGSVDGLRSR